VLSPLGGTIGIFSSINTSNVSTSNTKFRFTTGTTSGLGAASWGGSGYTWGGDFNGDGIGDIASASGGTMYFKLGNGQSFTGGARTVFNQWGGSGFTFAADFNADGRTDIASANGGSVYMRMNVQAPGADLIPAVEESTWFVANQWGGSGFTFAADFNGDGFADLASASGSTIYMKLNVGNAFQSYPLTGIGSWGGSGYTFTGDFNNDGRADIVSFNGSSAYMKLGTSNGSFSVQTWNIGGAGAGSWGGSGYT
jgi:hypothetical protein